MHRARKIGWGFFTNPEGFDSVAQGGGSGGGAGEVAGERGVFLPAIPGGEGSDEAEITDEFCFSGRAEGSHQGANHWIGGIAEFFGHFGHAGAHGRRNAGTSPKGEGNCYFRHTAPFGNRIEGWLHLLLSRYGYIR